MSIFSFVKTTTASAQRAIVIGGSAGSIKVVVDILQQIKGNPGVPIIISLHRLRTDGSSCLRNVLQYRTHLPVIEPKTGDRIEKNKIYLAPANQHLIVERNCTFTLSSSERVNHSRPSVDLLFMSASEVYGRNLIGILLTGCNNDGAEGMKKIKEFQGLTIVQDLKECLVNSMPKAAMKVTRIDHEFTTVEIANFINRQPVAR